MRGIPEKVFAAVRTTSPAFPASLTRAPRGAWAGSRPDARVPPGVVAAPWFEVPAP